MKRYLLPQDGNFYKANLHCHTTFSDGRKTPEEVKEIYKSKGYSIVAYTDHDILIPHDELNDDGFLALHGFELEVVEKSDKTFPFVGTCHICLIGLDPENITQPCWGEKYLFANAKKHRDEVKTDKGEPPFEREYTPEGVSEIMRRCREKGFFVTYNHPTWSLENYSHYMNYHGMHALEIFNGSCLIGGYEDYNPRVYDDMLRRGERIFCVGGDDNHNVREVSSRYCDSGQAFTVIKAASLDYKDVTSALLSGSLYASEAPEIYELYFENGRVHITCSDADRIIYTCSVRKAAIRLNEDGGCINEATFDVSETDKYFRLTVIDKSGKHACTNAYFTDAI